MIYSSNVWFIILTYQPSKLKLLARLRVFKGLPYILVDNSVQKNEYPKDINVLQTGENLGYAGGMNRGIAYCLSHGATWVVVANEDIDITEKALKDFVEKLRAVNPGIAGPTIGKLDKKRWTTILGEGVDYISGSFMAIHRKVIDQIGKFYEPYFIYYEDTELCVRARRAGFPLTHMPLRFSHADGTTFGANSFLHQYYLARNHLLFVARNSPVEVKLYEFLRHPKTIWEHVIKKEWGALTGIRDYFFRRFGIYKSLW